jgi:hypothetical protein
MMTMVISGSDGVTFPDSTNQFSGGAFSFKNRLINGGMVIDQRNAGASVTLASGAATYAVDRFSTLVNTSQVTTCTIQQVSDAPATFTKSFKFTTGTGAAATSSQQARFYQAIEGFNCADLAWGTASAKTVTVSFWVKSSQTGTFGGCFREGDAATRSYPFTYTISSANTWEQKSVTVAGDTSGTWNTTNGAAITVIFDLGSGSNFLGTAGAWAAANYLGATGGTSTVATSGATWQVTGVQLEVGSVATPFERRPYGTELALCQRYCYQAIGRDVGSTSSDWAGGGYSPLTTLSLTPINLPVTMRSASGQSLVLSSSVGNYSALNGAGSAVTATAVVLDTPSVRCPVIGVTVSGLTVGQGSAFYVSSSANRAFITSEL